MFGIGSILGEAAVPAIQAVGNIVDKLFTSDEERLSKQEAMARLAQQPQLAQVELNKIEAAHRSIFVAGWRPFIGWVCGSALAWHFIVRDLLVWVMALSGSTAEPPPDLAIDSLMTVLLSLLGLGGLRTVEKLSGRAR